MKGERGRMKSWKEERKKEGDCRERRKHGCEEKKERRRMEMRKRKERREEERKGWSEGSMDGKRRRKRGKDGVMGE